MLLTSTAIFALSCGRPPGAPTEGDEALKDPLGASNASNPKSRKPVVPLLDCVSDLGGGRFRAELGFDNPGRGVTIPVGAQNRFEPAPEGRGQPDAFESGRHPRVFSVDFDGQPLTWRLRGQKVTASSASARCATTPPGPGLPRSCVGAMQLIATRSFNPPGSSDADAVLDHPVTVDPPASIAVLVGRTDSATAQLSFDSGGTTVTCTYAAPPRAPGPDPADVGQGGCLVFRACSNGAHPGDDFSSAHAHLTVMGGDSGDPAGLIRVEVPFGRLDACGTAVEFPNPIQGVRDPAARGDRFDPRTLPPDPGVIREQEEESLLDIMNATIRTNSLAKNKSQTISRTIVAPSVVMVNVTVTGTTGPLELRVERAGRVLARASSTPAPPFNAVLFVRLPEVSAGALSVIVTNRSSKTAVTNTAVGVIKLSDIPVMP